MPEILSMEDALKKYLKNHSSLMMGGFLGCNAPLMAIDKIIELGIKDLTLISAVNSFPGGGFEIGLLFDHGLIKKFIGSHIGTNPTAVKQYAEGKLEVDYYPQGTVIEKIRCAGFGLGGFLTPTGLGTLMEEGKQKITVNGREYLLEEPLGADVAIIKADKADKMGNLVYSGTMNSNPIMASAADITIAEVSEIVEVGEIAPEDVQTPGIFVDVLCVGYSFDQYRERMREMWNKLGLMRK